MRLLATLVAASASRVVQFHEAAEGSAVNLVPAPALAGPARVARARAPDPVAALHELPGVRYTVPSAPRGWRGRADRGEDPAVWYDAEGPRNGPPPNYWRQSMDERTHAAALEALRVAAGAGPGDTSPLWEAAFDDKLRSGIKNPTRNRKLLGSWVPIVLNGRRVATIAQGALDAPLTVTFKRAAPGRIQIHRYGVFEDHLEPGEEVEVTLEGAASRSNATLAPEGFTWGYDTSQPDAEIDTVQRARITPGDNTRVALPLTLPDGGALHLGGVTLLSDYLLVARGADGDVQDVLMRVSPASLAEPETNEPPKKFVARMQAKFPAARVSDPSATKEKAPAEKAPAA